jgi:hypothetical protein
MGTRSVRAEPTRQKLSVYCRRSYLEVSSQEGSHVLGHLLLRPRCGRAIEVSYFTYLKSSNKNGRQILPLAS